MLKLTKSQRITNEMGKLGINIPCPYNSITILLRVCND